VSVAPVALVGGHQSPRTRNVPGGWPNYSLKRTAANRRGIFIQFAAAAA
jgi:hypothetical protein